MESVLNEWVMDEVEVYAIKDEHINVIKLKDEAEELKLHAKYDGVRAPTTPMRMLNDHAFFSVS